MNNLTWGSSGFRKHLERLINTTSLPSVPHRWQAFPLPLLHCCVCREKKEFMQAGGTVGFVYRTWLPVLLPHDLLRIKRLDFTAPSICRFWERLLLSGCFGEGIAKQLVTLKCSHSPLPTVLISVVSVIWGQPWSENIKLKISEIIHL